MRRKIIITLTFVLLGILLIAPVAAVTSQGLDWTVEVGDHHYYNVLYWEEGIYFHEDMYFNISSNHLALPDPLTDWWDIPEPPAYLYYTNGTSPTMMFNLVFIYAMKLFVPIENWTLMTELIENVTYWDFFSADIENVSVVENTWLHWGFTYNITAEPGEIMCKNTYLKSNGAFARQQLVAYNATYGTIFAEITIYSDGVPPVVESPDDIAYEEGEVGHSIIWNATDMSPGGYMLLKDDTDLKHGFWNSSSEFITVNVDGLDVGSHNYTILFYEASGISTSDTVMVEVSAPTTTTPTPTTTTTPTSPTTSTPTSPTTTTPTTTGGFDLPEFLSENIVLIVSVGSGALILIIAIAIFRKRS